MLMLWLILFALWNVVTGDDRPNIIFFMTDDWGFNDVGYNLNTDTQTPFINKIAMEESLIISKYYALPLCTISRAALLTGRYPMRYGLQHNIIDYESNYALTKKEILISQEFQTQGYMTHMVGKWHLGHLTWDYTPTYRFFDTFLGYYGGAMYYYEHLGYNQYTTYSAFDIHYNTHFYDEPHTYSLDIWSEYANKIVKEQGQAVRGSKEKEESKAVDPFFLYIAWQGSHTPSESTLDYYNLYALPNYENITSSNSMYKRLHFQAQTTHSDTFFESLVSNLKSEKIWDNTLLIFCSDNGAEATAGDNTPLRGIKGSLYEGGIRIPAFITGGYLSENLKGKVFDEYPVHVTDWYLTLLHAAGINTINNMQRDPATSDGKNVWNLLQTANKNSRDYFSLKNTITGQNDIEEIIENDFDNIVNSYNGDYEELLSITQDRYILVNVDSYNCNSKICGALIYGGRWKLVYSDNNELTTRESNWYRTFAIDDSMDVLGCGSIPSDLISDDNLDDTLGMCKSSVCLFDLLNDPCEYYDISKKNKKMKKLTKKLYNVLSGFYKKQAYPLHQYIGIINDTSLVQPLSNDGTIGWWAPWDHVHTNWRDLDFEILLEQFYHMDEETAHHSNNNSNNNKETKSIFDAIILLLTLIGLVVLIVIGLIVKRLYKNLCNTTSYENNNNMVKTNTVMINEKTPLITIT